jgi:hypothetical protein
MRKFEGGRLLDRIAYCMRPETKVKDIIGGEITVRPTFPYNPDSKTASNTAHHWATMYTHGQKYEPEVVTFDNVPFSVTIVDLDIRSEGGRAYKVIDNEFRQFDLREDQVVEVMKLCGIQPRGVIPGTFVWGILGSQVRLTLVGGELHKSMTKGAIDKKDFELAQAAGLTPTEATLQPRHIYRKRDQTLHVFLGKVKRPNCSKTCFAFMKLPTREAPTEPYEQPYTHGSITDAWRIDHRKGYDTRANWKSMTWRERCTFDWVTQYSMYGGARNYENWESIVMMASPKFEADVGELDGEFFEELKANVRGKHAYRTSTGYNDLSEEWRLGPGARRPHVSSDYRLSHQEREEALRKGQRQQELDVLNTRKEYRDALKWL